MNYKHARTHTILKTLAEGLLVTAAGSSKGLSMAVKEIAEQASLPQKQVRDWIEYATKQGWIVHRQSEDGVKVALSDKGQVRWQKLQLEQPLQGKRWDKKWRIVIFDIPSKKKKERDGFRWKLKQLGLVQLQESVWITPWDCTLEISLITQEYGLSPFVKLLVCSRFENDQEILVKFST